MSFIDRAGRAQQLLPWRRCCWLLGSAALSLPSCVCAGTYRMQLPPPASLSLSDALFSCLYTVQLSLPTPAMHCTASFSLRQCIPSPSYWHALCSHATTQLPSRSPPPHYQLLQPEVAGGRGSEDRLPRRRRGSLPDCQGRQRPLLAAPPPPPSLPF